MKFFVRRLVPACLAVLCLLPAGAQAGWRDGYYFEDGWEDQPVPPANVGRRPVIVYPSPRQGGGVIVYNRRGEPVYLGPPRGYYADEGMSPDYGDPDDDAYVAPRPRRLVKPRPPVTARLPDTAEPDVVPSLAPPKPAPKPKLTKVVPAAPLKQKPVAAPVTATLPAPVVAPKPPLVAAPPAVETAALPAPAAPVSPPPAVEPLAPASRALPAQAALPAAKPAVAKSEPMIIDLPVPAELTRPAVQETVRAAAVAKKPAPVALPVPRPNLEGMDFEAPAGANAPDLQQ